MQAAELTGFILAGGKSSRMGQDKASMSLGGVTLAERARRILGGVCSEVLIVGPDVMPEVSSIQDHFRGSGPLGGIEAALGYLSGEWALFVPVDMPLLPADLFKGLVHYWLSAALPGCRIAYPVVDGIPQPLVCAVHRSAVDSIRRSVAEGKNKVVAAFDAAASELAQKEHVGVEVVLQRTELPSSGPLPAFLHWSPDASERLTRSLWFANLNTPDSFKEAQELLCSAESSPRSGASG